MSSESLVLRKRRTMTMTKIPSRKTCYTYGCGHLQNLIETSVAAKDIAAAITSTRCDCGSLSFMPLSRARLSLLIVA